MDCCSNRYVHADAANTSGSSGSSSGSMTSEDRTVTMLCLVW